MYWNIQNFGATPPYKANYDPLFGVIAAVVELAQVDVLFIQELKAPAVANYLLQRLQEALWALPAPRNNWHYEYIKGSIRNDGGAVAPYATSNDLDWDAAHYEGYAVFWNQNIAKFRVTPAPPVVPPGGGGPVANTQSETARMRGDVAFGVPPVVLPLWGIAVPAGGLVTPPDPAYVLPPGTTAPVGAAINNAGGGQVVAAGGVLGAPANVNSGTVLPQGTQIGPAGVQLTAQTYNRNPVVIPGGYTLTEPFTLPAPGTVLVPEHALSLVLTGRDTRGGGPNPVTFVGDISPATANFNPGAAHPWQYLYFTRGAGMPASLLGSRRPAFITIEVNINGAPGPAQQLIPLIVYHAPSAPPASSSGMQRAAYSRPLYQAYDHAAGAWINNARAVLGGDMNVVLDTTAYAYNAFTNGFGAGGANCQLRVAAPALAPPPATRADNPANQTTAQINSPPVGGAPIVNANLNAYRSLAIDNVFYRGFAPPQAPVPAATPVYDLLAAVSNAAVAFNIPPARVQPFLNIPVFQANLAVAYGLAPGPPPNTVGIRSILDFLNDVFVGTFTMPANYGIDPPARRAAEFVHLCVSDHLPVLFTMNL
ncbi:MAG TPA: hypothetical protein VF158_05595 [Longimicrobiales bacterium]